MWKDFDVGRLTPKSQLQPAKAPAVHCPEPVAGLRAPAQPPASHFPFTEPQTLVQPQPLNGPAVHFLLRS
jgi:hypothetical protein